jgi:hypothetical protein
MSARMPDSNSAAERQRDRTEARRERFAVSPEKALDDLVERMMDAECYPRHSRGRSQTHLIDILVETVDPVDLAELVSMFLHGASDAETRVKNIVRRYLDGSKWVDMRADEMAREAEEG